jgi:hypothetical protein
VGFSRVSEIGREPYDARACRFEVDNHLLHIGFLPSSDDDRGPFAGERLGDDTSDAARASRH